MSSRKTKIQIVFIVIFFLAVGLAAVVNYRNFAQKRDAYYARLQDELSTAYGVTTFANQEIARFVFNTYINQPDILELYKNANSADESVRHEVRQRLYKKLLPLYEQLKAINVRQFHFYLPNGESFLRFHRPEKYGDSLKGVRYSVDKANAELVAVSGFEEGRIFDGFRNVFPLIYNGEHLGSVEISMDFDAIRKRMEQQFHHKYAFMIQRRLVENKVFEDEQGNYQPSDLSDDYLYERHYAVGDTIKAINADLKPKIQERLKTGQGFVAEAKAPNAARLVVFFPVKNVQGQQTAYIVSYNDDATISGYYSEFVVTLAISIAGILVIIALLYLLTNALRRLRAEKVTLKQKREQFRRFMNASPSLTFIKDATFRYLFANDQTANFFGKSIDDILGKTDREIAEEGKIAPCFSSDKKVLENDTLITVEEKLGAQIYEVIKFPLTLPDGEKGIGGIINDITKRKKVEEKLQESETKFRRLAETTSAGIMIYQNDYWIYANPAAEMITGYRFNELKQMEIWAVVSPEYVNLIKERGQARQRGEYALSGYEFKIITKQGKEKWVFLTGNTLELNTGKAGLITVIDITARKQAEERLHNEREKLFVTLHSIGDGVITTDTEGRVTFMNGAAEQLTVWNQEEAAGQPLVRVFNIINEKTGDPVGNPVTKVLKSGKIIDLANHTALIARDGTRRSIADSGAPIFDSQGKIIGVVLVFRDVTGKKKREEELLKIKKLESVGVLAGGIAHDFNNILMAILGNINLADIYIEKGNKAHTLLKEAEKASLRARNLTQQLLTFSKGGEPVRETSSIKQVITDSADFVLHGSNVKCRYAIPKELWMVDIDTGQMSQVIQNIAINARHSMPEGGEIKISCENIVDITAETGLSLPEEKYIKITIADTGGGIPEKYLDKIFDPYFTTKQQGSGLGLAVTHSIINKHDGHIFVRSKSGEGTTFTIYLPASAEQISHDSGEELQKPEKTMKGTILVMDDEQMIRNVAKKMLSRFGHEVLQAKDGREAIAIFREHHHSDNPVDVIIMDLTIPGGMGGKDAIEEILKIDPDAKAIVSSGYSNDPVMANYRRYGFKASIGKPFEMTQLKDTVNSVLG